jgi:hypothetical protein
VCVRAHNRFDCLPSHVISLVDRRTDRQRSRGAIRIPTTPALPTPPGRRVDEAWGGGDSRESLCVGFHPTFGQGGNCQRISRSCLAFPLYTRTNVQIHTDTHIHTYITYTHRQTRSKHPYPNTIPTNDPPSPPFSALLGAGRLYRLHTHCTVDSPTSTHSFPFSLTKASLWCVDSELQGRVGPSLRCQ